jgi:DNA replicative helicase MCM subunit Mcm2 (Cdc46/Mcm family)
VSENLKMSGALFSRFDLVFIMLDRPDDVHDKRLSRHIVNMHRGARADTAASSAGLAAPGEVRCTDSRRARSARD